MCSDLISSPQACLPACLGPWQGRNDSSEGSSHSFRSAACCRQVRSASQEPGLCSLTVFHLHPPPSVAPVLPAPLCSAICSHHIGIITWDREGLAFCEVGEMGRS